MPFTNPVSVTGSSLPTAVTLGGPAVILIASRVAGDVNDRYDLAVDGSMQWGPGAAAADTQLARTGIGQLTLTGRLIATAGVDSSGSPSGTDGGEFRFATAGVGLSSILSTIATGSPVTSFQHRGAGNTGTWQWGNGTGGASVRMTLGAAGLLGVLGGLDVTGSPSGYSSGELRFPAAAGEMAISTMSATADVFMNFDHRAVGNTGQWAFRNGVGAGNTRVTISKTGAITAAGGDHWFGSSAFGSGGTRIHLGSIGDTVAAHVRAEGSLTNCALAFRSQGTHDTQSTIDFVRGNGETMFRVHGDVPSAQDSGVTISAQLGGALVTRRVTLGAADSGGVGKRTLLVAN